MIPRYKHLEYECIFRPFKFPSVQSLTFELRYQKANFRQGKIFEWCVSIFSFRNIKVHARPRRLVLTHSVMLDFTVKSENIGAVTCSASRRTSADRCQNLRFGDTNFRLWCPVHLQLCFSARVNTLRPSLPIIRRSKIVFCQTQRVPPLRDLIRVPTSASLCVTLDYPLRHGQSKSLKTQAVTGISPSSSLRICQLTFSATADRGKRLRWLCLDLRFRVAEVQVSDLVLLSRTSGQLQTVGSSGGIKSLDETKWILGGPWRTSLSPDRAN